MCFVSNDTVFFSCDIFTAHWPAMFLDEYTPLKIYCYNTNVLWKIGWLYIAHTVSTA